MNETYGYPDDKELEKLIAQVEENGIIAPPVYLKEQIMEEISREEQKEISVPAAQRPTESKQSRERRAKVQFLVYSTKIVAAAAAAIFSLTVIPVDTVPGGIDSNHRVEQQIEKDAERYRKEKEQLLNESAVLPNGAGRIGTAGEGILKNIVNWFEMEEKNDD